MSDEAPLDVTMGAGDPTGAVKSTFAPFGAGGGFTAKGLLSGFGTVGGIIGTLGAASSKAASYNLAADTTETQSIQQDASALQRETQMKQQLLKVLGSNTVSAAAAGIDTGYGIGKDANEYASTQAATQITTDRYTEDAQRSDMAARAAAYRSMASQAMSGGIFDAIGKAFGAAAMFM